MFFFYNCSFCQYQTSYVVKDTLFVNFKNEFYSKIANDSIKKIYDQQKRLGVSNGISSKYRFEDLEFKSIPIYTFKKNSYLLYSCKKDILSFIDFENVIIFQKVIIIKGDIILNFLITPNIDIETAINFDLNKHYGLSKSDYENDILNNFREISPISIKNEIWFRRKHNFFFYLMGIDGLFEVEKESGKVFVNLSYSKERLPINQYIRQEVGERKIKTLSLGYYSDIMGCDLLDNQNCQDINPEPDGFFVKVEYK